MKHITLEDKWPRSWRDSYAYDLLEIYGSVYCYGGAYAYANRRQHTLELVKKVSVPGAKILDVAAAQGNFSLYLAELGYRVTWNDLREELAEYVKLKHEQGDIEYAPGNVFDLGFEEDFDVVLITEIIEHVAHPDEFLEKIKHLVKPGGSIVMTTPNGGYFLNTLPKFTECKNPSVFEAIQFKPNSDGHIFLLHPDEIDGLAQKAGLIVMEKRLFTNPLTSGHIKTERLLKIAPKLMVTTIENFTRSLPPIVREKLHTAMAVLLTRPV